MLFNFVLYLALLNFFLESSVTDESFVDETRVWRIYKIKSWYLWWVFLHVEQEMRIRELYKHMQNKLRVTHVEQKM